MASTSGTLYNHPPVLKEAGDKNSEVMKDMAADATA